MSKPKIRTQGDFNLPAINNDNFNSWTYNVIDCFKDKTVAEIRAELQATAHPFAVLFENWQGDFNISTGIRNANSFNAKEVFYIGNKKFDKRGSVGTYNYTPVQWLSSKDELLKLKERYVFIGIDNIPGSVSISTYQFPTNSLLIFGEEGVGLTPDTQKLCQAMVSIDQFGSVRSLNCGTASGIIMYEFVRQLKLKNNSP